MTLTAGFVFCVFVKTAKGVVAFDVDMMNGDWCTSLKIKPKLNNKPQQITLIPSYVEGESAWSYGIAKDDVKNFTHEEVSVDKAEFESIFGLIETLAKLNSINRNLEIEYMTGENGSLWARKCESFTIQPEVANITGMSLTSVSYEQLLALFQREDGTASKLPWPWCWPTGDNVTVGNLRVLSRILPSQPSKVWTIDNLRGAANAKPGSPERVVRRSVVYIVNPAENVPQRSFPLPL